MKNFKNGIHFNGDASSGGDGLHTGITVAGNIIYQNNANGVDADGLYDSLFVNNLIYDNGRHGIRVFRIDATLGSGNLTFVNNSIADNASMAIKLTADIGGHLFFNNILTGNVQGCISVENNNFISDNNIFTNNCVFEPNNASLFFGATSLTSTSAQIFTDPAAADYTLKIGSAAENTGLFSFNGTDAPELDISGMKRDVNTDIGAYES